MHLQTLLFCYLLSLAYGLDRQITAELNPDCETCDSNTTLVYIKAEGSHDIVHQIWDFTRGMPTIIFVISDLNSTLQVIWRDSQPVKFKIDKPIYSFAAVLDKLQEYDDIFDRGQIDNQTPQRELSFRNIKAWMCNESVLTNTEAMLHMRGQYADQSRNGVIDIKLDLLPFKDYAVDLPHLIHTANSTLVDVSLVNLTTSRDYNASRYAIHFVLVSTDSWRDGMVFTMRKSMDDEHTPGVFEIYEVKTPKSYRSNDGGFIQFRPVGYTESERSVSSSTNAYISSFISGDLPSASTVSTFYRSYDRDNLLIQGMFISFGLPGDGCYRQHNFTSWSFSIGYGAPPVESFSLFVVIIISIGLGVPVLLAMSGITYVLVRRCKQRNTATRFTNEE